MANEKFPTIKLSTTECDKGKTRRKLRQSDVDAIFKDDPHNAIFRCVKVDLYQMAFWCPYCAKEHHHGWDPRQFVITHRVSHCQYGKGRPFERRGYFLYWDGTEKR